VDQLRWALLGLGTAFLGGLALWEWRKPRHEARVSDARGALEIPTAGRREPSIGEFSAPPELSEFPSLELPQINTTEPIRLEISAEEAVDVPGESAAARVSIRWPPASSERVLSLRIVGRADKQLNGRRVRQSLQGAAMHHGPQQIFHRITEDGDVLASVANLVRPGSFNLLAMDAQSFRGLNLFCVLPGPVSNEQMLDGLVSLARQLAGKLEAVVHDEFGEELLAEQLTQLRRSVASAASSAEDGAQP
jgi:FtsZ-interacting cell division protein ZipA